jgi:hypothetical protein
MNTEGSTATFNEILHQKLHSTVHFEPEFADVFTMEWSSSLDPKHLSYLMGKADLRLNLPAKPTKNPYSKYKKLIIKPDHPMTPLELSAFEFINFQLDSHQQIAKNFTVLELKRGYKKAALRLHPDCGGSHSSFLELKSGFELLMAFLTSIK